MNSQIIKDLIAGIFSGWAQICINQPFDFVKTKFQTTLINSYTTIKNNMTILMWFKYIYSQYGLFGFYRGSSSLFFASGLVVAVQFAVYQNFKRFIKFQKLDQKQRNSVLKLYEIGIAGGIVGLSTSFIYCPVEHAKLLLQMQKKQSNENINHYKSSIGAIIKLIKQKNGIFQLYKGIIPIIVRDIPGASLYFMNYQFIIRFFNNFSSVTKIGKSFEYLIAGGISGLVYWLYAYPHDTLKTKVQIGMSYRNAFQQCYRDKSFYRGSKVAIISCIPVHAMNFFTYQNVRQYLQKKQKKQLKNII